MKYYEILWNIVKYCEILWNILKYCKILLARTEVFIINKKCHKTNYMIIDWSMRIFSNQ
jgi:hypothetical protein